MATKTGTTGADSLFGTNGVDILVGNDGNDVIKGGAGNDLIFGDMVTSTVTDVQKIITDDIAANKIADALSYITTATFTGSGNDTLIGNAGDDILVGGAGNDTYVVDSSSDLVLEGASQGTDTVISYVNYALLSGSQVENLTLTDTIGGSTTANTATTATGNDLSNTINGNKLNNVLSGAAGGDTLNGGAGNDTVNGGEGNDYLRGNAGNDSLVGGNGNDALCGGAGSDTMDGGAGSDAFGFNSPLSAIDSIVGFDVVNDRIQLDPMVFANLSATAHVLNASELAIGTGSVTATDNLIYNPATGALSYDADANGAGAAVQFATLGTNLALTHSDFSWAVWQG
ncbi:MAG: calcium-binding protein [Methylococcaceae bacterium]